MVTGGLRPGENATVSETLTYNLVSGPSARITMLVTDENAVAIGSHRRDRQRQFDRADRVKNNFCA